MSSETEVYALRYATMRGRRASEVFERYDVYGLEDRVLDMDCYFWLIRSGSSVTLLDCGWNRSVGLPRSGRYAHIEVEERDPVGLLAQVGVEPGDVDTVIVSHMHFDHVGNLDLFPDADLVIARRELETWTGPWGRHPVLSLSVLPEEVARVAAYADRGRLQLVDDTARLGSGVVATTVGGHTPGQMLVEVATEVSTVILASDAVHYHEELHADRPFYHYSDLVATLSTYEGLRRRAAEAGTRVISGHDPIEMERHVQVTDHVVDLMRPLPPARTS